MNEKLVTIVVLPHAKAHILKMRFDAVKIECELEDFHLIEGAITSTVRVKISEKDIASAMNELDLFLGMARNLTEPKPEKRQILVPIDFSEVSKKAAQLAFNLASYLSAELVVMHSYLSPINYAVPIGDFYPIDTSPLIQTKEVEQNTNTNFRNFISNLTESIGKDKWDKLNPSYIIKPGYANDDILAYAKEHQPRLIVIGRGGDKSWPGTVGSVTADVMFNAPVPVLVVPEEMKEKKVSDFKEILYATNFDAKDFTVLDKLMGILRPFKIKLSCTHVGQPNENGWDLARLEGMKDILHKKYKEREFECKLIMGNDVINTLENYLEDEEIDALALTTHKRSIITRLFNPSLAREMVFHTKLPLLVFHA